MDMLNLRGDAEARVIEGQMTQCCGSLEEMKSVVGQMEEGEVGFDQAVTNEQNQLAEGQLGGDNA